MLLSITLIGSVSNVYSQLQSAKPLVVLMLVLLYFLFAIMQYFFPKIVTNIIEFIKNGGGKFLLILVSTLTVIWQLLLVIGLSGNTTWDPSIITTLAANKSIASWYPDYFSYNPNNIFLLVLERIINNSLHFIGITSYPAFIMILSVTSYFLIDVSIFIYCTEENF